MPTVLCLTDAGWLVGDAAERRAVTEPERIARTCKRRVLPCRSVRLRTRR